MLTSIKKFIQKNREDKVPHPSFCFELIMEEYQNFLLQVSRFGQGVGGLQFAKPVALKVFCILIIYLGI
jgi:hypothetical protein